MHAERLLLLVDELDELTVALREACTFGGLCTLLIALIAVAAWLRSASLPLAVATFLIGVATLGGLSAVRRPAPAPVRARR